MYKIIIMYLRVLIKNIFVCLFVTIIFVISSIFRPFTDKSHTTAYIYLLFMHLRFTRSKNSSLQSFTLFIQDNETKITLC